MLQVTMHPTQQIDEDASTKNQILTSQTVPAISITQHVGGNKASRYFFMASICIMARA
jgi:hypothetical protein